MADDGEGLSAYERVRAANIARNAAVLSELGIDQHLIQKPKPNARTKRPRDVKRAPTRELSRRTRQMPVPMYTPGQDEALAEEAREEEIEDGKRLPDGSWLGERFGEVDGVSVGTVFGRGDYQRLGRQEMMDSGFFRPFVTPEWVAPGEGCYSVGVLCFELAPCGNAAIDAIQFTAFVPRLCAQIILNNDNGASSDVGDVIRYAGSGGRQRGQNRTAPQSFHQDWSNVTNAALRLNCEMNRPVRVVRGPKLQGAHGTAASGGGYRYDGLYIVQTAELVCLPGSKLRTCMFTLKRM